MKSYAHSFKIKWHSQPVAFTGSALRHCAGTCSAFAPNWSSFEDFAVLATALIHVHAPET